MEIWGSGGQKYLRSSARTNIGLFGGHIGISISNKILSFAIRDKLRFAGMIDGIYGKEYSIVASNHVG